MINNTLLDQEQINLPEDKSYVNKYQLKIQHLNSLNKKIYLENTELRQKIKSLEHEKQSFVDSYMDQNDIITNLTKLLEVQKQRNQELSKKNQQLLSTILLNEQMNIETKKQSDFYVSRYEQKIMQLRQSLQLKELHTQAIEQKCEKFKSLTLPMNSKNANRFTFEILKYENLIEQLIQQRNKESFKSIQEINNVLSSFNAEPQPQTKSKKTKNLKTNCTTDLRNNMNNMAAESTFIGQMDSIKFDVLFLKLHLELRQLKKKYRERLEDIAELKSKDKVMKQGYNTLTKEMEKIRVQNCQLKIQLEHLDKKLKTCKDLSKAKSAGNIPKRLHTLENAESKIESSVSIEGNCEYGRRQLKVHFPTSQTKYDTQMSVTKSHNFDQQIQNIEGILSLDSNPDFKNFLNAKQMKNNHESQGSNLNGRDNEQILSICEESEAHEVDLSISLDASGFLAPQRSRHQIHDNFLTGLIDNKVL